MSNKTPEMNVFALQQWSILTFGFSTGSGPLGWESHINVTATSHDVSFDTPEIRKYKKKSSESENNNE